jgi:hypothetical protein
VSEFLLFFFSFFFPLSHQLPRRRPRYFSVAGVVPRLSASWGEIEGEITLLLPPHKLKMGLLILSKSRKKWFKQPN